MSTFKLIETPVRTRWVGTIRVFTEDEEDLKAAETYARSILATILREEYAARVYISDIIRVTSTTFDVRFEVPRKV